MRISRSAIRRTIAITGAVALSAGLVACGASGEPGPGASATSLDADLRVVWWGPEARATATETALDTVSEALPGVTFTTEWSGFDGYFEKLTTQIAGGGAPDLAQMNFVPELYDYSSRSALLNLDPYVESGALDLSGFTEESIDAGRIDGHLYAVPFGISSQAVLANSATFEEYGIDTPDADWTWDDFAEVAQQIADSSGGAMAGSIDASALYPWYETWYLGTSGKQIYDADLERTDNADDVAEWWEFWADLRESGAIVAPDVQAASVTGDYTTSPLVTGKAAMSFEFSAAETGFRDLVPAQVLLLTQPTASGGPSQYIRPSSMFSILAETEHPDAAVAALNELITNDDALMALGMSRGVPASSTARELVAGDLSPADQQLVSFLDEVSSGPLTVSSAVVPDGQRDVEELFTRLGTQVAFGELTPNAAAEQFFSEVKGITG
jgi:multiple sugar transport system substrate-binding protein